jgi:cell wall-active antibiotic response 4TMS protein YvqF
MSDNPKCRCPRCTIRSLLGPAIIVTVGVLFLLQQMRGGYFDFGNTWPVILIVIGLISLASAFASSEGHGSAVPPAPSAIPPTQSVPPSPSGAAPTSYPGQGQ